METSLTIRRKISSVGDLASTMTKKRSKRRRSRPLNDPSLRGQNNRTIIGGFDINRLSRLCRYLKKKKRVCFVNNEIKIYFLTFFLKTKKFFVTYTTRISVIPSFYNKLNKANVIRSSFHHIIWKTLKRPYMTHPWRKKVMSSSKTVVTKSRSRTWPSVDNSSSDITSKLDISETESNNSEKNSQQDIGSISFKSSWKVKNIILSKITTLPKQCTLNALNLLFVYFVVNFQIWKVTNYKMCSLENLILDNFTLEASGFLLKVLR